MNDSRLLQLANEYGTPTYVFDADDFALRCAEVDKAIGEKARLCYCVKAGGFLLRCLPDSVKALEVCSPGELELCKRAGVDPKLIVFSGLVKTEKSIADAVDFGVGVLTAESLGQLDLLNAEGLRRDQALPVLLRLTGGDQFGMDESEVRFAVETRKNYPGVDMVGLHHFTGTQKKKPSKIEKELAYVTEFADGLERDFGFVTKRLEFGPGFFADYFGEDADSAELDMLAQCSEAIQKAADRFELTIELGRFLASPCGTYLTKVLEVKTNHSGRYAIIDGGTHQINYDGQILGLRVPPVTVLTGGGEPETCTICGSLCAISDRLVQHSQLPAVKAGDILAFRRAGAYGITEGKALFLSRELPRVVLAKGDEAVLLRDFIPTDQFNG